MAARPILHKLERDIAAVGGPEAVLLRYAMGESANMIAKEFGVSGSLLKFHFRRDPERKLQWRAAQLTRSPVVRRLGVTDATFYRRIAQAGGEYGILTQIAAGTTIKKIADELKIQRPRLVQWLNENPVRAQSYKKASTESAGALADEAVQIIDTVATENAAVQKAREQVNTRKWLAAIRDRSTFAEKNAAELNISIGALHLDALRKLGGPHIPSQPALEGGEIPLADVEMLPSE